MAPRHFIECGPRPLDQRLWAPSFPVLADPESSEEHIVYKRDLMKGDSAFCRVAGMAKGGTLRAFVVPTRDYDVSCQSARKQFVETNGVSSPSAILVDPSGRMLV